MWWNMAATLSCHLSVYRSVAPQTANQANHLLWGNWKISGNPAPNVFSCNRSREFVMSGGNPLLSCNGEEMGPEEGYTTDSGDEMQFDEEPEIQDLPPEEIAELKKTEGNKLYAAKSYAKAVALYTEAISLCPSCAAYYGNRAASFMMLGQYSKALDDARQSLQIDPAFVKGHLREAKCHLAMGEAVPAVRSYNTVLQFEPQNNVAHTEMEQAKRVQQFTEKATSSFEKKDYRTVLFCMDRCIELSPDCRKFRLLKAECLALLRRYQESQEIANDMLRFDSMNVEALYVRGLCLYYQDSVDKAFSHFQQVLRLAPDHVKAKLCYRKAKLLVQKKEEGNAAFRAGRLQEAHGLYTEALAIDLDNIFTNSKLYCNRATVSSKTGKNEEAIKDCTTAIELDDTYLKAYMRRARSYMDSELYEEAVRDYEKIFKMDKTHANKQLLSQAKLELKKSKRKDYYKVLGVSKTAQEDEIKKAYRKRALLHHPDRHASATDEVKKNEEKKFKEIGEAYSVLSDPKKKSRYDSGQDLDDMEGPGFHHQDFDPNMIFQSFFGGGGGPSFGGASFGGPGGGGPGFSNFQGPGGFSFQFG